MADQQTTDAATGNHTAATGFRWRLGLIVVGLGVVLEALVWFVIAPDRTYQVMFSLPVVSGTALTTSLWWLFFSGLSGTTRLLGVAAVGGLLGIFNHKYRFEGFDGAMMPRFSSRSEPTREERLEEFLASSRPKDQFDGDDKPLILPVPYPGENNADAAPEVSPPILLITSDDWPGFRGPQRDGVVRSLAVKVDWTQTPKELWRHPVGAGWSSFAVAGGRAFTQEQRGERECVVCYDIRTGQQIWEHADDVRFEEAMGGIGPRATPTLFDSRVYTVGAKGALNCLDAMTGERLWSTNILEDAGVDNLEWAMSGSPLIRDDVVIVLPGGANGIAAYDRISGMLRWSNGQHPASYSAPMIATLDGVEQFLWFHGEGLAGHDINGGRELWNFDFQNQPKVNAAQPIVVDETTVMIGSGYTLGAASLNIKKTGDETWEVATNWTENRRFKLKFNPAVRRGDYAYGLDEGILECIDLRSGKVSWKRGRYGYGQLLLVDDVVIVQTEDGEVAYVAADPEEFNELLRFPALSATTWNHPVLWNDLLLVRNGEEAVCFELSSTE